MTEVKEIDVRVKLAVYRHFAETGRAPNPGETAARAGTTRENVLDSYPRLRSARVLLPDARDPAAIRMAPPFSGVPTPHLVESEGLSYYANCAWDALGIPAALRRSALVRSHCGRSEEPLILEVSMQGPPHTDWLFHCGVPAAHWWDDLVFT